MAVFRNQTNTLTQIQLMTRMRITTTQEAVAFLRALAPLQEQVMGVLQRTAIQEQQARNRRAIPAPVASVEATPEPITEPIIEPEKKFEAEDLSSDEGFSESEIEAKVEKLKKAKSTKKSRTVNEKSQ